MDQDARKQQRKGYTMMRSVYDLGFGFFIVIIGGIVLLGTKMGIPALKTFLEDRGDPFLLTIFGCICLLYGGFRLYRGFKKDY